MGSLLRTAEGLGVQEVYLTGYTPYPQASPDTRMPHLAAKTDRQIHKTALGAEKTQRWHHAPSINAVLYELQKQGYVLAAIEQSATSTPLPAFKPPEKIVLVVGNEVEGVEQEVLARMNHILEIPMFGEKESFNVVQAAAIGLYHCRFT